MIRPEFELVGSSAGQIKLFSRHGVNLLAVSRRGRRIAHRLRSVKFRPGDVIVLQGDLTTMPETLGELDCLPLAERDLRMGRKESYLPTAVLAAAMALVAHAGDGARRLSLRRLLEARSAALDHRARGRRAADHGLLAARPVAYGSREAVAAHSIGAAGTSPGFASAIT